LVWPSFLRAAGHCDTLPRYKSRALGELILFYGFRVPKIWPDSLAFADEKASRVGSSTLPHGAAD